EGNFSRAGRGGHGGMPALAPPAALLVLDRGKGEQRPGPGIRGGQQGRRPRGPAGGYRVPDRGRDHDRQAPARLSGLPRAGNPPLLPARERERGGTVGGRRAVRSERVAGGGGGPHRPPRLPQPRHRGGGRRPRKPDPGRPRAPALRRGRTEGQGAGGRRRIHPGAGRLGPLGLSLAARGGSRPRGAPTGRDRGRRRAGPRSELHGDPAGNGPGFPSGRGLRGDHGPHPGAEPLRCVQHRPPVHGRAHGAGRSRPRVPLRRGPHARELREPRGGGRRLPPGGGDVHRRLAPHADPGRGRHRRRDLGQQPRPGRRDVGTGGDARAPRPGGHRARRGRAGPRRGQGAHDLRPRRDEDRDPLAPQHPRLRVGLGHGDDPRHGPASGGRAEGGRRTPARRGRPRRRDAALGRGVPGGAGTRPGRARARRGGRGRRPRRRRPRPLAQGDRDVRGGPHLLRRRQLPPGSILVRGDLDRHLRRDHPLRGPNSPGRARPLRSAGLRPTQLPRPRGRRRQGAEKDLRRLPRPRVRGPRRQI
ncbi:MAG: hypothetical protein AVDCRST_MAG12-3021, partial [uncultured Rubrobacteraceae bacterium]